MLLSRASLRCALLGIKCGCACGFKCARYKPELRPAVGPRLASTAMGFVLYIPPPTKFEIERLCRGERNKRNSRSNFSTRFEPKFEVRQRPFAFI